MQSDVAELKSKLLSQVGHCSSRPATVKTRTRVRTARPWRPPGSLAIVRPPTALCKVIAGPSLPAQDKGAKRLEAIHALLSNFVSGELNRTARSGRWAQDLFRVNSACPPAG